MKTEGLGLYPMNEAMPCTPEKLSILRYTIPGTLGNFEKEEAAARILSFSLSKEQWVGVSWGRLVDMMREDYEAHKRARDMSRHNDEELERAAHATTRYYVLCVLTLGIYALFVKKSPPYQCVYAESVPVMSGIFVLGPQHVQQGLDELVESGLLRLEEVDGDDVFFPTPALVTRILTAQRMQRSAGG